jgi:hypothetical protein
VQSLLPLRSLNGAVLVHAAADSNDARRLVVGFCPQQAHDGLPANLTVEAGSKYLTQLRRGERTIRKCENLQRVAL